MATLAPIAEPINAGRPITAANLKSGLIFLKYEAVAPKVPRNEGTLLVPRITEGEVSGSETRRAGS